MKELYELVSIVKKIKVQKIEIIGSGNSTYSKLTQNLYKGILENKYETDEEAAQSIYGPNYNLNNFSRLKTRLSEKLINTLFFINLSEYNFTDFQETYYNTEKLKAAIKILLGRGARTTAIKLAEKLIKKNIEYGLTDNILDLSRILCRHYRTNNISISKSTYYANLVETNLKIQRAEIALENYYDLLMLDLYKSKKSKKSIQQKVTETAKGTREIYAQYQSFKIGRIAHTIFVLEQELKKDYESMLVCCQEAIRYFEAKKNSVSKEIISFFYRSMMTACIPLKNFSEGEKHAKKSLSTVIEGSLDWYRTLDQYYILSLHTKNYKKANDIFEKACKFYRFNHIPILNQEIWRVYSAYQEYLRHQGLIEKTEIKPFRINKFMNDVPNYSKDKKGINISIIIIQVLFLIAQKKETQVINRVDSLRVYVHTHLRNDDSFRSNCFIKMLVKMIQANFHKEGTIRKTKDLYEKLVASPLISSNGRNQYIEIIPYEHLWEMNLSYLHNRAY